MLIIRCVDQIPLGNQLGQQRVVAFDESGDLVTTLGQHR